MTNLQAKQDKTETLSRNLQRRTFCAPLAHAKGCPVEPEDLVGARNGAAVVGVQYLRAKPQPQNRTTDPSHRTAQHSPMPQDETMVFTHQNGETADRPVLPPHVR